ncbi:MAG TPA: hypothetical protein VHE55_08240 [Fimbriimonadaceae bacterium]|nr:hypothetical protein [Fimbriimonadaceae bacterium]
MRNGFRFIGLAAVAALSLTVLAAQDAIVLKRIAKVGDVEKYRMKAEAQVEGGAAVFTGVITEKITKVADDGQYTMESTTTDNAVSFNGKDIPGGAAGAADVATITCKASGEVVSVVTDRADPNIYRMANLQALQFPSTPIKLGDSWDVTIKKDDRGSVDAKGTFKLEAKEKIGDYDCYRIRGSIKETAGDTPAAVEETFWVSAKDGTIVKSQGSFSNAPFPGANKPLDARVEVNRIG